MIRLFYWLSRLPLAWQHALGALLGWLVWCASPTYRRHFRANLALALGPSGARAACRPAIAEAGRQMIELPNIWLHSLDDTVRLVTQVSGWELVEEAWRGEARGILFLTPHLGCFEITAQYYAARRPITVLYRPPKRAWLQTLILRGRARERLHLAPADLSGVRGLIKALRRGEAVGMLPDQAPAAGEGRWLDFFGRPAYTMTLAARLSETGAVVILAWAERLPGGRGYHLRFSRPGQPLAGDTAARAQIINHELEALIRACPAQYLWGYNRYKIPAGAEPPPAALRAKPGIPS